MTDDGPDPRFVEYRRHGDRRVRNALVEEHRGLALAVANRYRDRGVDLDDLRQVALLGLIAAVERFDPERGVPFPPWATMVVDGEVKTWFRDRTWAVKVNRSTKDLTLRLRRARQDAEQASGRSPSVAELADRLGESEERIIEALDADAAYRPTSLDAPTLSGRSADPGVTDEGLDDVDRRALVEELLAQLDESTARIVRLRFYDELSQHEIAAREGVSQMQVSRVLRRALDRLRTTLEHDS